MTNALSNELQRLTTNHQALLDITPEMVMLVDSSGSIEYMNPNSSVFVSRFVAKEGLEKLQLQLNKIISSLSSRDNDDRSLIGVISNLFFECRTAPFAGYNGDRLHWLILSNPVRKEVESDKDLSPKIGNTNIIGSSKEIENLHSIITRVASTDTTVLISGESGTGKELVANSLVEKSLRRNKAFLTINCNTISDLLLESELFGYERGSFTGADKQRKGKFEIADGGTIFLDEIGDISPRMQAALLRVLQHGEFTRVGGHKPIKVDVRIIAATNRNLAESVKNDTFRLDLFYRLNIINIVLPPLRKRKEDIFELSAHFIQHFSKLFNKPVDLSPQKIIKKLEQYDWPGNVRELENVIHRAVLMCKRSSLSNQDITFDMQQPFDNKTNKALSMDPDFSDDQPLKNIIEEIEKDVIYRKLKADRGNVSRTAASLNISKAALYDKMKRYGLSAKSLR